MAPEDVVDDGVELVGLADVTMPEEVGLDSVEDVVSPVVSCAAPELVELV